MGKEFPPPVLEEIIQTSAIADVVTGSVYDLAIMERVVKDALAGKEAEMEALKQELAEEKTAVMILRELAESTVIETDDKREYVLQQQADLDVAKKRIDDERRMLKAAVRVFLETTKL